MGLLNYSKVYSKTIYIVLGIFLWFFIYQSGLHATLAGVITAILIPSREKEI
jgi:NhaA family Na+:H+ antiporter